MKLTLIAVAAYVAVYILPLGVRPLLVPDETRYAEVPREMLASGDFVVPRIDGLRYFEKPVLGYWLIAGSIRLFGQNAFAVRLPSALAMGVCALVVFLLERRYAQAGGVGGLAAVMLLTSGLAFGVGTFAVLDSVFSLCVTLTMAAFFCAYMADHRGERLVCLAICGLSCGAAFLAKGFLAVVLPVIVIVPFMLWSREWKRLFSMPWIPMAVAVAVTLPWCLAIHVRESDFWRYFVFEEHLRRFLADNAQHSEPFWFFIPVLIAGILPWTVLAPASFVGIRGTSIRTPFTRFLLCWTVLPFVFFSLSRGKLGTYILPCLPPLMLLMAMGLIRYSKNGGKTAFIRGAVVWGWVAVVVSVVLALTPLSRIPGFTFSRFADICKWPVCLVLSVWALLSFLAGAATSPRRRIVLFALAPVFCLSVLPFLVAQYNHGDAPRAFLVAHADQIEPDATVVSNGSLAPAVCWYLKRSDVSILERSGELRYGLSRADSQRRFLDIPRFNAWVSSSGRTNDVVLLLEARRYDKCRGQLAEPSREYVVNGFAYACYSAR